ncbi:MAG TPA: hypothetical protein VIM73_09335 [Polyangiaceae bacterium]
MALEARERELVAHCLVARPRSCESASPLRRTGQICGPNYWTGICKVLYNMKKVARVPVSEARKNLANLLGLVANGTRVKVTRYDKTLGGIISSDDLVSLSECEESRRKSGSRKRRQNDRSSRGARAR